LATVSKSLDESEQFADNEVELRRVSGVNAPVVSRDQVFSAPVTYRLQNIKLGHDSRRVCNTPPNGADTTQQDKFSTCSVSKFSSAVVGRRRELVANSIHTADADATPTQLNSTVESRRRRRCVLGISSRFVIIKILESHIR